jgi:hypothetical protein
MDVVQSLRAIVGNDGVLDAKGSSGNNRFARLV